MRKAAGHLPMRRTHDDHIQKANRDKMLPSSVLNAIEPACRSTVRIDRLPCLPDE